MDTETGISSPTHRATLWDLTRAGALALALSLVVNWLVVFGADAVDLAPELTALHYGPVTLLTTGGVVGATGTYGALSLLVDNPDRAFVAVATVVLVISLLPDFVIIPDEPGGSLLAGAVLGAMHVTTAVICVGVLTAYPERSDRREVG